MSEEWAKKFNEESELAWERLTRRHWKTSRPEEKFFSYTSVPRPSTEFPALTYADMEELPEEVVVPKKYVLKVANPPPDPALLAHLCADFTEALLEPGTLISRRWWTAEVHKDYDMMTEHIYLSARLGVQKGY